MKNRVGIVDYGSGNHGSVFNAVSDLGYEIITSSSRNDLEACGILILPGVGSYASAMKGLAKNGLDHMLIRRCRNKQPILGICLGMQLFVDSGTEGGYTRGLGLIPGQARRIQCRLPHIGWNTVVESRSQDAISFEQSQDFYFNHSYVIDCSEDLISAKSFHGELFPSVVTWERHLVGLQFHPEKSQNSGIRLLSSILGKMCNA